MDYTGVENLHSQNSIKGFCFPVLTVFESRDKIVIVMEYASRGELYDYIQERRRLPETEARSIFRQITSAVHYCHKVYTHQTTYPHVFCRCPTGIHYKLANCTQARVHTCKYCTA